MNFRRLSYNREFLFVGSLFLILWLYLLLRIIHVPFLEDEIATWFIYVMHGRILPLSGYVDANNHILNSSLAWVVAKLFNSAPALLRLPNFLFFPVYFYYSYKITRLIQVRFVRLTVFVGLIMAHHLFDFFGLCRGYGLAMGFLMAAGFHMVQYLNGQKFKDLLVVTICIFFMVWAHLSLMSTAYIFFALILINILLSAKSKLQKRWLIIFIIISFGLILGFSTWYSLYLQKVGKIYLGIDEGGFVKVTALTLIDVLFGKKSIPVFLLGLAFTLFILAVTFLDLIKKGLRDFLNNPSNLFTILIIGNIFLIYFNHWVLGVVYPQERATLYLYPLLLIALGFATDKLIKTKGKILIASIVAPLLLIPLHFISSLNLDYASAYRLESYPERYIRFIQKEAEQCDVYPIIGIYDEDRWVYDHFRYGGNIPFISENTYPDTVADFQIGKYKDNPYMINLYDSLDYDSRNDFLLLQRKHFLKRTPLLHYEQISTNGINNTEYFGLAPDNTQDSLTGTHFLYYYDLTVSSPQYAFEGFIISSLKDTPIYEIIALDRIAEHWNKRRIRAGVLIRETAPISKIPLAYFWNKYKVPFEIEQGSLTIYNIGD